MMLFQGGYFYLFLVVVLQLCIQEVQSDRLSEVNDLNTVREKAGEDGGRVNFSQQEKHPDLASEISKQGRVSC